MTLSFFGIIRKIFLCGSVICTVISCTRKEPEAPAQALRPAKCPVFKDRLPKESLLAVLRGDIALLQSGKGPEIFAFVDVQMSREDYVRGLERFLNLVTTTDPNAEDFQKIVAEEFNCYEVFGREHWGEVFVSSYFSPVIPASRKKTPQHSIPLYRPPADLVSIPLNSFLTAMPWLGKRVAAEENNLPSLRGRLVTAKNASVNPTIVPYYDRHQIDIGHALEGKKLEIAWVDPVDAFFLHIQGSGALEFSDQKPKIIRVGVANKNGFHYDSLGKFLTNQIPLKDMTMQSIETYLRSLSVSDQLALMSKNQSYVFFTELEGKPLSTLGTEVTAGRTIATDSHLFQKGTLAFLDVETPVFESVDTATPTGWESTPRFVMDQDTGGAIQGGGRVDLYWGEGPIAKQAAGVMKNEGKLVYLVPKK